MAAMQIAMTNAIQAGTVHYPADDGADIEAYLAVPQDETPKGGVVLIHHLPGYDEATREFARTFAVHGYNAIVPNLYSREGGPGISHEDAAAAVRADGGVPDERLVADVGSAAEYLRALPTARSAASGIAPAGVRRCSRPAGWTCRRPSTTTAPS